jgi:nucleoside-diphosphate-sugar epimerase
MPSVTSAGSAMKNVFVTGASGCVGHYVVEALLARGDCRLHLLVRDPAKLLVPLSEDRVRLIQDDLLNLEAHADRLAEMDAVVHLATSWGGAIAEEVNVEATAKLARLVDPARCKAFLYFSTASILGRDNRPLEAAEAHGTEYIRSKYRAYQRLETLPNRDAVTVMFPTLIFGGSPHHPVSHLSRGLPTILKTLWFLRWFTLDGTLHYIHAADIARMVSHLIDHPAPARDLVLGNAPTTVSQLIGQLCDYYALPHGPAIDLTPLGEVVAALAGSRMTEWDRFSLTYQHFTYQTVNPRALGLSPGLEAIADILAEHEGREGFRPELVAL